MMIREKKTKRPLIHIEVSSFEKSAGMNAPLPSVGETRISTRVIGIQNFANVSHAENICSPAKNRTAETITRAMERLNIGSNTEKTKLSNQLLSGHDSGYTPQ
jgi:hypothetical protein